MPTSSCRSETRPDKRSRSTCSGASGSANWARCAIAVTLSTLSTLGCGADRPGFDAADDGIVGVLAGTIGDHDSTGIPSTSDDSGLESDAHASKSTGESSDDGEASEAGNDELGDVDTPRFDLGVVPDIGVIPSECSTLPIILRDFHGAHADFESFLGGLEKGMVASALDVDRKPAYSGIGAQISTLDSFRQWYRDVAGVNMAIPAQLVLVPGDDEGECVYQNPGYFPLDGLGFGNEGRAHNYHFTTEIHTEFTYRGGEIFEFRGDDDVWVFINGALALDIGGVHGAVAETIELDVLASALGIVRGRRYPLDMFHAERHTSESNFFIATTIGVEPPPG